MHTHKEKIRYVERACIVKGKGACIRNIYETCICTLLIVEEKVVIAGMDASSPAHGHGCPFAGVDLLFHNAQLSTKHVEYMLQIQHPFPLLHIERSPRRNLLQLCNIILCKF